MASKQPFSATNYKKIDELLGKSKNVKIFCKLYQISDTCKNIMPFLSNRIAREYITYTLESKSSNKRKRGTSENDDSSNADSDTDANTVIIPNSSKKSKPLPNVNPIEFNKSSSSAKSATSAKSAISIPNTVIIARKSINTSNTSNTSNLWKKTLIPPSPPQLLQQRKQSVKHCSCCGMPHLRITTCGKNANHPCSKCNGGPSDVSFVNHTPQIGNFTHVTPTSDY